MEHGKKKGGNWNPFQLQQITGTGNKTDNFEFLPLRASPWKCTDTTEMIVFHTILFFVCSSRVFRSLALGIAIQTLKNEDVSRPQAMLQLQKMAVKMQGMRHVLAALLETGEGKETAHGGPEVAAYEFQSGGIPGRRRSRWQFRIEPRIMSRLIDRTIIWLIIDGGGKYKSHRLGTWG